MVRHRWTLALILISVPILATVITAFRVRDLPRSSLDGSKPVSKKQYKCENCDVNELDLAQTLHSFKFESVKRYSDDLKKSVRDKQKVINEKNKSARDDDDDDDDDENDDDDDDSVSKLKLSKTVVVKTQDHSKKGQVEIENLNRKSGTEGENNDDEDEDDDDDDDDYDDEDDEDTTNDDDDDSDKRIKRKLKKSSLGTKSDSLKIKTPILKSVTINDDNDNDDDDDDDDDNDDENPKTDFKESSKERIKKDRILKKPSSNVKPTVKTMSPRSVKFGKDDDNDDDDDDDDDDNDDDDDDNDDDDDDNSIKNIDKRQKKEQTDTLKKRAIIKSKGLLHDDDENDDDDSDKDDDEEKILNKDKPSISENKKIVIPSKKSASKVVTKDVKRKEIEDDDGDSDDNDDDDDDEDNKLLKSSKSTNKVDMLASKQTSQVRDVKKLTKDEDKKLKDKKEAQDESVSKIKTKTQTKPEIKVSEVVKKELNAFFEGEDLKQEPVKKLKQDRVTSKKDEKIKKDTTKENLKEDKAKVDKKDVKIETGKKKQSKRDRQNEVVTPKKVADILQEKMVISEGYIKQVSEVLQRKKLLQSEFEDFYAFFPTFAPNFSRIANPECRRHGQILLRQLRGTKLWALNMLDATAKIPSGILQGNGIQLGDFDQCLSSRARVQLDTGSVVKVQGKYCLARFEVKAEHPELEVPVHLAQAKNLFNSRIDDPGHFVPRFSTLSWGVCVPAPCLSEDVEAILKDAIKHYQHKIGVVVRVKVDEIDCHTRQNNKWWEKWMEMPTLATLTFYGVIVLLVIVATILDYLNRKNSEDEGEGEKPETDEGKEDSDETKDQEQSGNGAKKSDGILSSFSLYRSIGKLIGPARADEISCIHGVRAISTIALLVAHKFLPTGVTPYTNRLDITETVSSPLWSWTRAGWIFTDSFLLLSGALKAHRVSLIDIVVSRYIRLTPALLAVSLFYAYIWDNISQGPMWGTLVTKNAEICQEGWWWNMLFIQNHFKMEEICAPQTHQLALDMQLSIFGWLIVLLTKSETILSRILVPSVHLVSAYLRYSTVRDHRLSMIAYHGMTVSQIYRTARLSYMSAFHRCSPYLIGLSLGQALRNPGRHGKLFLTFGWLVSSTLWGMVLWAGYDSGSTEYRYNTTFAAQYAALAPIASAVGLAWLIYVVHGGYCGFLSKLLCCRPLLFISRLSYAIYLIQFLVFFTNAATVKTSSEFTLLSMVDAQEISMILLSAVILTLTFVTPMQSLYRESSTESKGEDKQEELKENGKLNSGQEETESEIKEEVEEVAKSPPVKRQSFVAHRELLEEIPEADVEYETQRDSIDALEEILEEEEDDSLHDHLEDDLEIIEEEQEPEEQDLEEQGGEEDYWADRREYISRRSYSRNSDRDLDEWEVTANGHGRNGAQHYRYSR